jgi:hypothetical protein
MPEPTSAAMRLAWHYEKPMAQALEAHRAGIPVVGVPACPARANDGSGRRYVVSRVCDWSAIRKFHWAALGWREGIRAFSCAALLGAVVVAIFYWGPVAGSERAEVHSIGETFQDVIGFACNHHRQGSEHGNVHVLPHSRVFNLMQRGEDPDHSEQWSAEIGERHADSNGGIVRLA